MDNYSLTICNVLYRVTCECCGSQKNRVWGLVCKGRDVHARYFAVLNTTEDVPRIGLTLAVGPWWGGPASAKTVWVHTEVRAEDEELQFVIRDPHEPNFSPWQKGGTPLTSEQESVNEAAQDIRPVANFVVRTDVAISSYLARGIVDLAGREQRDSDHPQRGC